ncbi:MAG TPA: hypothetical protein VMU83_22200 [Hanamia sp.]|nr:hypothetical protein [Hanamia sp.]
MPAKPQIKKITIHNKITNNFRHSHVDGAYAGITPRGLVSVSFFSERGPIPKASDFRITDENKLGELISNSSDSKTGILREFEVGIYLDIMTTKALITLLSEKVIEFEKLNLKTNLK